MAGIWELGVLHAVIGHEGDGKTTLLAQTAEGAARAGHVVQLFTPEDPREMLVDRALASVVGASAFDIRRLKLGDPATVPERLVAAKQTMGWARNILVEDRRQDSTTIIEAMYDAYSDHCTSLVGLDYAQVFGAEADERSVERVISSLAWRFNEFCKNPTRSRAALGPPPDEKCAGVILSQVGSHVKRRGIEWFNESKKNARYRFSEREREREDVRPTVEWIEGFRPLPGDAQWAPTSLGQKARVVLSILRPNDVLTTMGVAGLKDDVMEILPIKNNYSRKPKMIRLHWDGARARLSELAKGAGHE
jgi:hypothetical protein